MNFSRFGFEARVFACLHVTVEVEVLSVTLDGMSLVLALVLLTC